MACSCYRAVCFSHSEGSLWKCRNWWGKLARKFVLFCHFICKYLLNAVPEPLLQLRREKMAERPGRPLAHKLTDQTVNQRGLDRRPAVCGAETRSWECWERISMAAGRGWILNERIRVGSFLFISDTET